MAATRLTLKQAHELGAKAVEDRFLAKRRTCLYAYITGTDPKVPFLQRPKTHGLNTPLVLVKPNIGEHFLACADCGERVIFLAVLTRLKA